MDSELTTKISGMVRQLASEEHARLRAAGTMVDLEELVCEIGDEFARQLMSQEMASRANDTAEQETCPCPDCGGASRQKEAKARQLAGLRGEVRYYEPTFYCRVCRRSFFPGSRANGTSPASDRHAEAATEDGLGRSAS